MDLVHRLIAAYLLLVGLAVAGYFLVYPLYAGGGDVDSAGDIWSVLNWFIAVAVVLLVMVAAHVKQAAADDGDRWRRFVVNLRFYGAIALALAFFSNWFADGWGGEVGPSSIVWIVVNIGLPILGINVAVQLWRDSDRG